MIEPKKVKDAAQKVRDENYDLRTVLKMQDYDEVDSGCSFLIDNECILGDAKPESCKEYPHLHKEEFGSRALNLIDQTEVCPMVYEVFERLKQCEWEEPDYSDFLEQFYAMNKKFDMNKINTVQAVSKKIGRNEPCPCGSGKKYKKCCEK